MLKLGILKLVVNLVVRYPTPVGLQLGSVECDEHTFVSVNSECLEVQSMQTPRRQVHQHPKFTVFWRCVQFKYVCP